MSQLQSVRGVHDIFPQDHRYVDAVVHAATHWATLYGFQPITLPVLEYEEVFRRSLGESSDVVSKEMFVLQSRDADPKQGGKDGGDARIVLRPEGTASVMRAILEAGQANTLPHKLFYWGPMFRYERPQKGRLRQFHQFGVEYIGTDSPYQDVQLIAMGYDILRTLGVADHVTLLLNTLGDKVSRAAYRDALVGYFSDHKDALSEESQRRLVTNPLRILDSKSPGDKALCAHAPVLTAYLSPESLAHFTTVQEELTRLGIPYTLDPHLVRGLDYYSHTAFEFVTDHLGAQSAVLAGGRYDGLMPAMGGPDLPSNLGAKGWALGIERLVLLMHALNLQLPRAAWRVGILPLGAAAAHGASQILQQVRQAGLIAEALWEGPLAKRLKKFDKMGFDSVLIQGEDEVAAGTILLKHLALGTQQTLPLADLAVTLKTITHAH